MSEFDTGLADLATEPPAPEPAAEPEVEAVTVAVTVTEPMPADWTVADLAALARDMALKLHNRDKLLAKHDLTEGQLKTIEANEAFQEILTGAAIELHSMKGTNQRLALEAAVAVEEALPSLAGRLKNEREPLANVVQGFAAVAKVAGLGDQAAKNAAPTERFSITINMGATRKIIGQDPAETITMEIQPEPEGESDSETVCQQREGDRPPVPVFALPAPSRTTEKV